MAPQDEFTDLDFMAFARDACLWTGAFDPAAAEWLWPWLRRMYDKGRPTREIELAIRRLGDQLSDDRKRILFVEPREPLGVFLMDELTPKGQRDPARALANTLHFAGHAAYLERERRIFRRAIARGSVFKLKLMTVPDGRNCRAATELSGTRFDPAGAPDLPLKACNAEICRCSYRYLAGRKLYDR